MNNLSQVLDQIDEFEGRKPQEERVSNNLYDITMLGFLESQFEWCGHLFAIRTLYIEEELTVAKLIHPYTDTAAYPKAFYAATTAACLISVDNEPFMPNVFGESTRIYIEKKFSHVMTWQFPVTEVITNKYLELAEQRNDLVRETEKKFQRDRVSLRDSFDPLSVKENSQEV